MQSAGTVNRSRAKMWRVNSGVCISTRVGDSGSASVCLRRDTILIKDKNPYLDNQLGNYAMPMLTGVSVLTPYFGLCPMLNTQTTTKHSTPSDQKAYFFPFHKTGFAK